MTKVRDYGKLARDILQEVGGESNIVSVSRCATRLRLVLREIPEQAADNIKQMPGVISVILSGGQFQVVIGTRVAEVYDELNNIVTVTKLATTGAKTRKLDAVLASLTAILAPVVYILAAGGILQGILILLRLLGPEVANSGTLTVLNYLSWTPFAFLPVFIGITAAKYFNCNTFIAVLCCCALVNPDWVAIAGRIAAGENLNFLGLPLSETKYGAAVLPPIFMVWALSYLERFVRKVIPTIVSDLLTPLVCMLVIVPLTLVIIGPLTSTVAYAIADGYNWLHETYPPVAAVLVGSLWQVLVVFGVHWGFTPVFIANFEMNGFDSGQALLTFAVIAQMAAVFAVALKTKNREFRATSLSAGVTAFIGITEPALYGVTLRLKKPFICGCIGGAAGALVASLFGAYYYAYAGLAGILTLVNAINPANPSSFIGMLLGTAVTIVVTTVLVYFVGFEDPAAKASATEQEQKPELEQAAA